MSTKDFIKKSVLNAFTQYDAPKLAVALLAALALGILIYLVYRKFYTGVVYSRSFAVTLVGMCVLTCMVTLAISTNVVISLGMVHCPSSASAPQSRTRWICYICSGRSPRASRREPECMHWGWSRRLS